MISRHARHVAVAIAAVPALAQKPPTTYQLDKKLIPAYLAERGRTAESRARQLAILAEVERVKPLRGSSERAWRKKLLKAWLKGRKLPTESGVQLFDEQNEKSRYMIGGETRRPKALVIALNNGGTGRGRLRGTHGMFDPAAKELGWMSLCPDMLEIAERGWVQADTYEMILDLIDAARRTWRIDPDRVYLTGHSRGGHGTWTIGAQHADLFAAIAPSAGAPTPIRDGSGKLLEFVEGVIPSLRNMFVVCYQSVDDPYIRPDSSRFAIQKLGEARKRWGGFEHEYWEVEKNGHNPPPGGVGALLAKIAQRKRDALPNKVVWQPVLDWKHQFYWLHWERPRVKAIVEAEYERATNEVRVTCGRDVAGLSVLLDPDMVDVKKEVVVKVGDKVVFRDRPQATLATLLMTAQDGDPRRMFAYRVPLDGAR